MEVDPKVLLNENKCKTMVFNTLKQQQFSTMIKVKGKVLETEICNKMIVGPGFLAQYLLLLCQNHSSIMKGDQLTSFSHIMKCEQEDNWYHQGEDLSFWKTVAFVPQSNETFIIEI